MKETNYQFLFCSRIFGISKDYVNSRNAPANEQKFIYIIREPTPAAAGSARINVKERGAKRAKKMKGIEA